CTLYHLLAATPPFGGVEHGSWLAKMKAHLETPVPPIRQCRPEVPRALVVVLDRMLAKNPADRFTIPAEVAAALQAFIAGSDLARLLEPVALRAKQTPPAFQKTPRPAASRRRFLDVARRYVRMPTLVGCGVLLAVAFVLGPRLWNSKLFVLFENC